MELKNKVLFMATYVFVSRYIVYYNVCYFSFINEFWGLRVGDE